MVVSCLRELFDSSTFILRKVILPLLKLNSQKQQTKFSSIVPQCTLGRLCYSYPCVIQPLVAVPIFFNRSLLYIQLSPKNSLEHPNYRPIPFYSNISEIASLIVCAPLRGSHNWTIYAHFYTFQHPPTNFWRYRRGHKFKHSILVNSLTSRKSAQSFFPGKNRIRKFREKNRIRKFREKIRISNFSFFS